MTTQKGPTLTSAKSLGGVTALDGFDYQVWDAFVRLPGWLRNPAFEGFAVEGLEDVEARFFSPQAPCRHVLDRFQAKSGVLDRAGLIEVLESFRTFETAHPQVARVQTLVTPALPPKLAWLLRDPGRVRRARPFYAPFAEVQAASDGKLRADLIEEFGQPLGSFFADAVEITLRPASGRATAEAEFSAALQQEFLDLDVSARKLSGAFSALSDLASQSRGVMLSRSRLLDTLRDVAGIEVIPSRSVLPIHVRSDRSEKALHAIEIDASAFSGGLLGFPEPETWRSGLVEPLMATASWARRNGIERISLSGSYRLSSAFALGSAFRSANGFEINIPTKTGPWATDTHPHALRSALPWTIKEPSALIGDRLAVGVGVLRDPAPDICSDLGVTNDRALLLATLPQALTDGLDAQASIQIVKAAISEAVTRLRPSAIDLYYVGPAAFGVALGHRWNALPPTQLREYLAAQRRYVPSLTLV